MKKVDKKMSFGATKTVVVGTMVSYFHQAFKPYDDIPYKIPWPYSPPQLPIAGIIALGLTFLIDRNDKEVELTIRATQTAGLWWVKTLLEQPLYHPVSSDPSVGSHKIVPASIGFSILCGLTLFEFGMRTPDDIKHSPLDFGRQLSLITISELMLLTLLTEEIHVIRIISFLSIGVITWIFIPGLCSTQIASNYNKLQVHQTWVVINIFITVIIPTFYNFPNQHYLYAITLLIYALARVFAKFSMKVVYGLLLSSTELATYIFIIKVVFSILNEIGPPFLKALFFVIDWAYFITLHVLYYGANVVISAFLAATLITHIIVSFTNKKKVPDRPPEYLEYPQLKWVAKVRDSLPSVRSRYITRE